MLGFVTGFEILDDLFQPS